MEMTGYLVIYEHTGRNWSAYVPDLPGCVASGMTQDDCRDSMREALVVFLDEAKKMGKVVPPPSTLAETINVA